MVRLELTRTSCWVQILHLSPAACPSVSLFAGTLESIVKLFSHGLLNCGFDVADTLAAFRSGQLKTALADAGVKSNI